MAILNSGRVEEYNKIQTIVNEVIENRKFKFDTDTILEVIKKKLLSSNVNNELLDCSYFYILVLNTLDKFVNEGKLYRIGDEFTPTDFLICVDYCPIPDRLLYYLDNDSVNKEKNFIDINNLEAISYDSINSSDFILCGGLIDDVNGDDKKIRQSEISLDEVIKLYRDLINEGASEKEAVLHLLNHYKVQVVSHNLSLGDEFITQKPQLKKLSRKKLFINSNE